jgi:putative ABC transport system permease protein
VSVLELLRLAWGSLRAHKLRSLLNLTGVLIAVTTIVAVIAVVSGLNSYAAGLVNQLGPNTIILAKFGLITSREQFLAANKRKDMTLEDIEAVRRATTLARRVSGRVFAGHPVYAEGRRLENMFVVGAGVEFPWMIGLEIADGRWFTDAEFRAGAPVAVVGYDIKEEIFPNVDPIGRTVKVRGKPFRIIGVMAEQGSSFGQSQDAFVAMPTPAFQKAFGKNRSIDIFLEARDEATREAMIDQARMVLRARMGTPFSAEDPFDVVDGEALMSLWRQITGLAFALVICISSVSLVVGGVAIANTMFASIVERTKEIGVRKAVGARRRDIRRQFLIEAVLLSLVGGVAGVAVGWLVSALVAALSPFPAQVTPLLVGSALLVALVAGLVAGWLPAVRVSRLDPVEALRAE